MGWGGWCGWEGSVVWFSLFEAGYVYAGAFDVLLEVLSVPDGVASVIEPVAGVDVEAIAGGGGDGFEGGGVGVSAEDDVGFAALKYAGGVAAEEVASGPV